jgi:hypothetical protein
MDNLDSSSGELHLNIQETLLCLRQRSGYINPIPEMNLMKVRDVCPRPVGLRNKVGVISHGNLLTSLS